MCSGRAFQVAGPACENDRSPNFVRSRGSSIDEVEDERSPQRDLLAPTDWTFRQIRRAATVVDAWTLWNINVRIQAINDKLQGSVATCSRCGVVVNNQIKKGLLLSLSVKRFLKSVNIC